MWNEDHQWHYDYVRLAWDTGFSFEKCKSPHLDKNKICVVDVEKIVKERDVASVDRFISTVVQYILDEEQAQVLDNNFVKIFRMSQLAVEYLLFCKKYLDNTVVLLKKEVAKNKDENKELKRLIGDLESHIATLTRQQFLTTFKCPTCLKAFSSEEYLNAHVKRRHTDAANNYSETDRLNTEIKELKERLNNTERLLQNKNESNNEEKNEWEVNGDNNNKSKLIEVVEKFEAFKNEVNSELKELRISKSFYDENYGKLFDKVMQIKENIDPRINTEKAEITTQTDKILQIDTVHNKNATEIQETGSTETPKPLTPKESLETRISATLTGIEMQMQNFWTKLNDLEQNKTAVVASLIDVDTGDKKERPKAKPRSKVTQPTGIIGQENNNIDKMKVAIEQLQKQEVENEETKEKSEAVERNSAFVKGIIPAKEELVEQTETGKSSSEDDSDLESILSESEVSNKEIAEASPVRKLINNRQNNTVLMTSESKENTTQKRKIATLESNSIIQKKESLKSSIDVNAEAIIISRLQELGISENWTRLPEKSFDKALEIINHQATLANKTHPNISSIKKKLIGKIENLCKNAKSKSKLEAKIHSPAKLEKLENIAKVSYRPKSSRSYKRPTKRQNLEIRNRELFESDSETDEHLPQQTKTFKNTANPLVRYSQVIQEIKSLPKPKPQTDSSDDLNNKEAQKGVLKSYPSFGSLSKKKVLFDLESESPEKNTAVALKTGGSTTSIASSILEDKLDGDKRDKDAEDAIKVIDKEFEDLSDFNLSDLETC
ncbi:cilium assembly protein DZIP1L isoform X2 [Euwallacea similis]|uniref:cilium assembly protein DZIP1L isoform X2 n=1 Tax=Euwallacea similis TaxID=1736056 RepID=UPI00344C0E3A